VSLAVAGGINRYTVADYLAFSPHIIIVGSGITRAADVATEAAYPHEIVQGAPR
jgi:3-keto-L-gulonate-6-phosphate decarboxylase